MQNEERINGLENQVRTLKRIVCMIFLFASLGCASTQTVSKNNHKNNQVIQDFIDRFETQIEQTQKEYSINKYKTFINVTPSDSINPFVVWGISSLAQNSKIKLGDKIIRISQNGIEYPLSEVYYPFTRKWWEIKNPLKQNPDSIEVDVLRGDEVIKGIRLEVFDAGIAIDEYKLLLSKFRSNEWQSAKNIIIESDVFTLFGSTYLISYCNEMECAHKLGYIDRNGFYEQARVAKMIIQKSKYNPELIDPNYAYSYRENVFNAAKNLRSIGQIESSIDLLNSLDIATDRYVVRNQKPIPITGSIVTGTGFFITSDGKLITNFHVIEDAKTIKVIDSKGNKYTASVISKSPSSDLALLDISQDTPFYLKLKSATDSSLGDEVFTIGYPMPGILGQEPKYSEGTISSLKSGLQDSNWFQISTPLHPGNSGGPLIDENGDVIGVIVASLNPGHVLVQAGTLPQNVNFAIRSDLAILMMNQSKVNVADFAIADDDVVAHTRSSICQVIVNR